MKKFLFISLLLILIINPVQSKSNVAVYATGLKDQFIRTNAESEMISKLGELDQYQILERNAEFLNKLQHELDYQYDGNVDSKQIATIGKQFGAQYVVVIQISEGYQRFYYASKMINVETAQIEVVANRQETPAKVAKLLVGEIKYKNFKVNKIVEKESILYLSDFRHELPEQKENNHLKMITDMELLEYLAIKYKERFSSKRILKSYSITKRPASIRSQTQVTYKVNLVEFSSDSDYISNSSDNEDLVFRANGNLVKGYEYVRFTLPFSILYYPSNLYEW